MSIMRSALETLVSGNVLSGQKAAEVMDCIMSGGASASQTAGFLTALSFRESTVEEIVGFARTMRSKAAKVQHSLSYCIDTCGTGGDGAGTFNISTAAAIVAAAAGAKIAKHGNRAMSGRSGSADVLEALGVNIALDPSQVGECMEKVGVGFMFAQLFHQSMKHAAGVRKELGIKTVFNILGPLTNPADAKGQLLGVYDEGMVYSMAEALRQLGAERALVVHGGDGLDEITITGRTKVAELKEDSITEYYIEPADFGIAQSDLKDIAGGDASHNAGIISSVLAGEKGAHRDIVIINAAAAIYVAKLAADLKEGTLIAADMLDSGRAALKLKELAAFTNVIGRKGEVPA